MKKVLITGGAGFVGRRFVKRFLDRGDTVHCVDNLAPLTGGLHPDKWPLFRPMDYDNFEFSQEDCRSFFARTVDTEYDYVLHLAAMVGGREMIEHNPLAVAEDLSIDAEYWQWACKTKPRKTICFSSSAAYPIKLQRRDGYVLLKEDMISFESDIGMPDMTYGWAKLTHEYLARLAYEKHGLRSVTYRPFSGYGEDQDMAYPFPSICRRVLGCQGQARLTVWGTGDQMRDFIYIDDCVDAVMETMDKIDDGGALNLSTGKLTSFKGFARMAAEICGYHPEVIGTSNKPEGVFARGGDREKQNQYGLAQPKDFRSGIAIALRYLEAGYSQP